MNLPQRLFVAGLLLICQVNSKAALLFVDLSSTRPEPPYLTWETAATNIQEAVLAAQPGDTVFVTNGVYNVGNTVVFGTMGNRVALTNGITLVSVGGPLVTTISGATQLRCAYVGSNSVLNGFTLTAGLANTTGDALQEMSGGGVWCEPDGIVTNCIIRDNSAPNGSTGGGGGAYGGKLYNCTLSGNYGLLGGGARNSLLANCLLTGNSSADGGASFQCLLRACVVSNNTSSPAGGGTAFGTNYNCLILSNLCTGPVAGNQAYGGGTYRSVNYNCLVVGNASLRGGGTYGGTHYNCTVIANFANDGGGVHANDTPFGSFTNCIIYFNSSPGGANNWSGGTFDSCCTWPLPGGAGNLTNAPALVDWQNGFYHLQCGSPCIDAGRDLSALFAEDLRGKLRPLDGNSDSNAWWDIGAYEYDAAADPVPVIQARFTSFTTQFAAPFGTGIGGCAAYFWWDFGDGILVTNQVSVGHAWAAPGQYDVRVTAYYPELLGTLAATSRVQVVQQQIHYANANNPTPAFPYTNWTTAATNIQLAIDATGQIGDLVLVTNGIYSSGGVVIYGQLTNRIAVTNRITVQSVNGPEVTIIRGGTQTRCAYVGSGAKLSGFTLTNGTARASGNATQELNGAGVWGEADATVHNCVIVSNSAPNTSTGGGGGAYGGRLVNCTLARNLASLGAGARSCVLSNCTLVDNGTIGYGHGGGAASSILYSCLLSNNSVAAYANGGGAYQSLLFNCVVVGNSTTARGGGATGSGGGTAGCTNYNCMFTANSAGANGGGTYQSANFNCILWSNTAYSGGGAYACTLYNCTLANNTASNSGGGFYSLSSADRVQNSILYFNFAPTAPNYSGGAFYYTCTTPAVAGLGNITGDPLFVDPAGGLYRLRCGSPCIDAGLSNAFVFATTNDVRGGLRPLDGNGDGSAQVDLGAYEYNPAADLAPGIRVGFKNASIVTNYAVGFTAQISGCPARFWWDFGDGVLITNQATVSHGWAAPGSYPVQLNADYPSLGLTLSATTKVQVLELVYFVDAANPTPVFPYTNWAKAATSIQQAIGAATNSLESILAGTSPMRRVLVTNGTYKAAGPILFGSLPNAVALTNVVLVQSVNGPQLTTITPLSSQSRCAYVGSNAILSGFTLSNGRTLSVGDTLKEQSGGGVWCEPGGTVINCVLAGNRANRSGGGAYQGTFYNCLFTNNANGFYGATAVQGGGAFGATLSNCTLIDNAAPSSGSSGGGAAQSTLANCTVTRNTANTSGGGAMFGSLTSCLVSSNSAYTGAGAGSNTLYNCILIGNNAFWQGGAAHGATLYHCTVVANTATSFGAGGGGGVYGSTVKNSIVYFNSLTGGYAFNTSLNYAGSSFNSSCTTPPLGLGVFDSDPLFVNLVSGDLRLRLGSACIDRGANLDSTAPNDFAGTLRPLDGDGDGIAVFDVGAYEFDLYGYVGRQWPESYGLNPADPLLFATDPDGDGLSTLQEWIANTNPTNAASSFRIDSISIGPPVEVSFYSSTNRFYSLFYSEDAVQNWTTVVGQVGVPGTGGPMTLQDTKAVPSRFYRLGVSPP